MKLSASLIILFVTVSSACAIPVPKGGNKAGNKGVKAPEPIGLGTGVKMPDIVPQAPVVDVPQVPDVPVVPLVDVPQVPDVPVVPVVDVPQVPDVPVVPVVDIPVVDVPQVPDVPVVDVPVVPKNNRKNKQTMKELIREIIRQEMKKMQHRIPVHRTPVYKKVEHKSQLKTTHKMHN